VVKLSKVRLWAFANTAIKLQLSSKRTIPLEGRKITESDRTLHLVSISCCSRNEQYRRETHVFNKLYRKVTDAN
jgi:hypothetical protein